MTVAPPGAWNFRDIAEGTGLRSGRLLRSSELSRLDDHGRRALAALSVTDVADLRSPREVERRGADQVPAEVTVHRLPFHGADTAPSSHDHSFARLLTDAADTQSAAEAAVAYLTEEYARFPTLPGARRAVAQVVSLLATGRTVVVHCFAGKDRTGFVVAVVLEALGVDRGTILADYRRSNDAVEVLRSRILDTVGGRDGPPPAAAQARLPDSVLGVREEYLAAAWRGIDAHHGSLADYLSAAGVTAAQLAALREALAG